jgi:hypothetical protein
MFSLSENAKAPMVVTLLGIVTPVKPVLLNAEGPILVRVEGSDTLSTSVLANALLPMLVTGRPSISAGIIRGGIEKGPWPVMVIVPFTTMDWSWACTATGATKTIPIKRTNYFILIADISWLEDSL